MTKMSKPDRMKDERRWAERLNPAAHQYSSTVKEAGAEKEERGGERVERWRDLRKGVLRNLEEISRYPVVTMPTS